VAAVAGAWGRAAEAAGEWDRAAAMAGAVAEARVVAAAAAAEVAAEAVEAWVVAAAVAGSRKAVWDSTRCSTPHRLLNGKVQRKMPGHSRSRLGP
jgi:hypothetical protein